MSHQAEDFRSEKNSNAAHENRVFRAFTAGMKLLGMAQYPAFVSPSPEERTRSGPQCPLVRPDWGTKLSGVALATGVLASPAG
jgi:hypothetical protein